MRILIDPPAKRSLNPNEQRVCKLLQEGLTPTEIARRLHMALQISNLANRHDVPPDTVMGLIASIREKGWEIPNTKEENNMAKGKKTPVETAHKTSELFKQGLSIADIVRETGVPQATVSRLCHKLDEKEEPAPSANDTSSNSKEEITSPNSISEIPADVNPADEIAGSDGFCCEVTGDTDMEAYMAEREKFLAAPKGVPTIVWEACMEKNGGTPRENQGGAGRYSSVG